MHTVFCIIGRTASGKSTIVNAVAKDLNLKILKSYTTRTRRQSEIGDNCDHTFISVDDVDKYRDDMVAYTERAGYCSFATKEQLMNSDIYIINPSGFSDLIESTKDIPDIRLVDIWIDCDSDQLIARSKSRSNSDNWKENYDKEETEFIKIYPNIDYDKSWHVDNNQYVSAAINHMKQIITVIKHEETYMSEAKENV